MLLVGLIEILRIYAQRALGTPLRDATQKTLRSVNKEEMEKLYNQYYLKR